MEITPEELPVLDDLFHNCRLCLAKEKVSVDIFSEGHEIRLLYYKIISCLPVHVSALLISLLTTWNIFYLCHSLSDHNLSDSLPRPSDRQWSKPLTLHPLSVTLKSFDLPSSTPDLTAESFQLIQG